jgi:hypothetical protein
MGSRILHTTSDYRTTAVLHQAIEPIMTVIVQHANFLHGLMDTQTFHISESVPRHMNLLHGSCRYQIHAQATNATVKFDSLLVTCALIGITTSCLIKMCPHTY